MRDVLPTLKRWTEDDKRFALATVTKTWGSSPRAVGSVMGVRSDGATCGSVSGGCVESSVIEEALQALESGEPRRLHFGQVSDEKAWEVGLSCGGEIDVWVDPAPVSRDPDLWKRLTERVAADQPSVLATRYEPLLQVLWTPGSPCDGLPAEIEEAYSERRSREVEGWFLNVLPCRDRLVIIGAVHIARALVPLAREVGFETVVVDPRKAFATSEAFGSQPDKIIDEWPEEALAEIELTEDTYAVVLTHDPKIDDAALAVLLRSKVAYIGALGSKATQAKKRKELSAQGFSDEELDRIHGPVGLSIGARSPEEIALSIMAEIVQVKRGRG
ncbi:MAG: XdhC family protein [Armatimonadetes bacterium]|nr:XdhC family protein [Armatimonadota bacterium]